MARRRSRRNRGRHTATPVGPEPRTAILRRRARKLAGKGQHRKAAVALRELVALEGDAVSWTLLGATLRKARRDDEALRAYRQAIWLHRRAGHDARARTVARLVTELDPMDEKSAALAL